jgi:hypothetical protein
MTAKNKDKAVGPIQQEENQLPGGVILETKQEPEVDWKAERLPRRVQLLEGAHLIAPASTKGGPGKSTTVIVLAMICERLGIPYIVANFDTTNSALAASLGDEGMIVELDARTPELARKSLSELTASARKQGAIILLDYPGAVDAKESSLLENVQRARILTRCDSFKMIAPISPDGRELEGAYRAIQIFEPEALLLRARRPSKHAPSFESFGEVWNVLKEYPVWECEQWTQAMKEVITRSGCYTHLPKVTELEKYLELNQGKISEVEQLDIEDVLAHVEDAAKAVYHFLLKDITKVVQVGV